MRRELEVLWRQQTDDGPRLLRVRQDIQPQHRAVSHGQLDQCEQCRQRGWMGQEELRGREGARMAFINARIGAKVRERSAQRPARSQRKNNQMDESGSRCDVHCAGTDRGRRGGAGKAGKRGR
jgi:hypothetical protein